MHARAPTPTPASPMLAPGSTRARASLARVRVPLRDSGQHVASAGGSSAAHDMPAGYNTGYNALGDVPPWNHCTGDGRAVLGAGVSCRWWRGHSGARALGAVRPTATPPSPRCSCPAVRDVLSALAPRLHPFSDLAPWCSFSDFHQLHLDICSCFPLRQKGMPQLPSKTWASTSSQRSACRRRRRRRALACARGCWLARVQGEYRRSRPGQPALLVLAAKQTRACEKNIHTRAAPCAVPPPPRCAAAVVAGERFLNGRKRELDAYVAAMWASALVGPVPAKHPFLQGPSLCASLAL